MQRRREKKKKKKLQHLIETDGMKGKKEEKKKKKLTYLSNLTRRVMRKREVVVRKRFIVITHLRANFANLKINLIKRSTR
jgi:hypothetical protein